MLIFLDIDGVMVPATNWKSPEFLEDGFPVFSKKATEALKKIVSEESTIILTTSHKSRYSLREWKSIFEARGILIDKLERLVDNENLLSRKDEIINWFKSNTVNEAFIIIDDDKSLNDLPTSLKDHLILTSPLIGLNSEHISQIQVLLNPEMHVI
jgi:16S rRNA C1402 (ribose-2'-O) methylase RsmI